MALVRIQSGKDQFIFNGADVMIEALEVAISERLRTGEGFVLGGFRDTPSLEDGEEMTVWVNPATPISFTYRPDDTHDGLQEIVDVIRESLRDYGAFQLPGSSDASAHPESS